MTEYTTARIQKRVHKKLRLVERRFKLKPSISSTLEKGLKALELLAKEGRINEV